MHIENSSQIIIHARSKRTERDNNNQISREQHEYNILKNNQEYTTMYESHTIKMYHTVTKQDR